MTELASPLMLVRGEMYIARFGAVASASPKTQNGEHFGGSGSSTPSPAPIAERDASAAALAAGSLITGA